jgi:peptide/nickel transport system permease protein
MVYGARTSILSALLAVLIGLTVGSFLGLVSGYLGGLVDTFLMRLVDVILSIPVLLLAMVLVTSIGVGSAQLAIAIGVGMVGAIARVMRSEVVRVRQLPFVDAERSLGARPAYILYRHILPNSFGPVLVLAVLELGSAILAIAALNFFGFGAPPPAPEWGSIVASGQSYMASAWWYTTIPGLVIAAVVVSVNRVAREYER